MSAIWGQISFNQTIEPKTGETMTQYFKDDFRLDDIQTYYTPSAYMGCGIQYITKEAENEKLPIYDEELCFNCDCILDNRNELLNALSITDLSIPDGRLMYQAYRKWGNTF